jgi:hypothetical protein
MNDEVKSFVLCDLSFPSRLQRENVLAGGAKYRKELSVRFLEFETLS